jgi:hypothetical protein
VACRLAVCEVPADRRVAPLINPELARETPKQGTRFVAADGVDAGDGVLEDAFYEGAVFYFTDSISPRHPKLPKARITPAAPFQTGRRQISNSPWPGK